MATSKRNTPKIPIINDDNKPWMIDACFKFRPDGNLRARGWVPKASCAADEWNPPQEMFSPPSEIEEIPQSEWKDRYEYLKANGALLSDVVKKRGPNGGRMKSYDQNGQGYCWFYSCIGAATVLRGKSNFPYVRFSGHAGACKIKNFRDQGGWCGLSRKFAAEVGLATAEDWPEQSMDRQYDNATTWANAAKHKITEDWVEIAPEYEQNLKFSQLASCLLGGDPCQVDFNWWSHSVTGLDVVPVEAGSFGLLIWNSWGDSWGEQGFSILQGSKAIPDGAVAHRVLAG